MRSLRSSSLSSRRSRSTDVWSSGGTSLERCWRWPTGAGNGKRTTPIMPSPFCSMAKCLCSRRDRRLTSLCLRRPPLQTGRQLSPNLSLFDALINRSWFPVLCLPADVGFGAELAWMSCQIERAFRFVEVLKKAAADPSNRSSIDPPLFRLSRSGSNSCCQSSLSIVS
jgi:hypothetical protein